MHRLAALLAVLIAAAVALASAGGDAGSSVRGLGPGTAQASLRPFDSCDRLRGYLERHETDLRTGGHPGIVEDAVASGEANAAGSAPVPPSGQTNVQETGVDEPDIVKVSERTLLVIAGDRLRTVDVSGAAPAVLDSIELPAGGSASYAEERELLLAGDRALVLASVYGPRGTRTLLTDLDVADPRAIRELATQSVEGDYVSARLTGETARVVVSSYPEAPVAETGHGRAILPRTTVRDRVTGLKTRRSLMPCEAVRRPARFSGTEMLSVLTVDLGGGLPAVDSDAVMAGGEIVYASPTSLYVATSRWFETQFAGDVTLTVPGQSEVRTEIHRFDIADPDATRYAASGSVEGYMLDQWSMSESDGVLRVASTGDPPWDAEGGGETESFVTSLALEGDRLVRIGRVGGLGRGEEIYAVRFIGELGYVVTFRQVDPLYVLDLSDPRDPRKLGELKIPGYSAYLHPVGEDLLLGVGQDATAEGQTTGVQVSLFDVSDPTAPVRIDRESLGRHSYSEVENDHRAFTYAAEERLAVLPLTRWTRSGGEAGEAVGIDVDPVSGLEPIARTSDGPGYARAIRRSVILDGRLFTISSAGVAEHDAATLARLSFTRFAG